MSSIDRLAVSVLPDLADRHARTTPDAIALVFEERARSFGELAERTDRLANALAARGVGRGDTVAVLMYNRLEVVEAFVACQKLGACPVPVNFRLAQAELEYVVGHSRAVGIIAADELAAAAAGLRRAIGAVGFHLAVGASAPDAEPYGEAIAAADPAPPGVPVTEDDLAFLMYTSGTTGRPKGAMLTHRNLLANTLNWVHEMDARPDDVWLSGLPLFHIGGVNGVLPFLYLGAPCVITPSTGFDAATSLDLLERHAVSMCFFVPTQWAEICAEQRRAPRDVGRLRTAMLGASSAPLPLLRELSATFPDAAIVNAFGQTEMSSNTCFLKGPDAVRKMGSVGLPVVNVEVRIVDERGDDVAQGEIGELVYRGPTVMKGYFENPEATEEAFAGGWFHGGDVGYADEEGYIFVVDRIKDMIISGGENVYPAEVERVLQEHPAVAEVAVIGVPHPKWVETPMAVIVSAPGARATEAELVALCRERLAGYKKPTAFAFVDALPRNATGKVVKPSLRERFATRP